LEELIMDPIGQIFMGLTLLLIIISIVVPQIEQRKNKQDE